MKSRFDALTSAADRRTLALFRASGAGAAIVFLLTLNAVHPGNGVSTAPAPGDLFAMEMGLPQAMTGPLAIAPVVVAARPAAVALSAATKDEFAFSPRYTAEPLGY